MKAKTFLLAIVAVLAWPASAATQLNDDTITIKVDKTSQLLVEQWIENYKNVNPHVLIKLVSGKNADADLTLVNTPQANGNVTYVGRYALLPVTSDNNPFLKDILHKEWKSKDLKSLFFTADDLDDEYEEQVEGRHNKLNDKLTVYSGSGKASHTNTFASYFGHTIDELRGNRIVGDDLHLLSALKEDKTSVTFNALSNLYDLRSRSLKTHLVLLPLALKKAQEEVLLSGNLDALLNIIENENVNLIPVQTFGFIYHTFDADIEQFLRWVVSTGQQYNHQQGFLRLSQDEVESQLQLLANN